MKHARFYIVAALLLMAIIQSACSDMMEDLENSSAAGSGFPASAVFITDAAGLDAIRNDPAGYYVLMADIDLSGYSISITPLFGAVKL